MARQVDRKTSNLIIAGGYCLAAIIILFNYLGETSRHKQFPSATPGATTVTANYKSNGDQEYLKKQLEEEKKINLEMRSLLRQIQRGTSAKGGVTPAEYSSEYVIKPLPELNVELLENALMPRKNPFIPGKNPYAAALRLKEVDKVAALSFSLGKSLKPDSRLPFVISGANSKSFVTGN